MVSGVLGRGERDVVAEARVGEVLREDRLMLQDGIEVARHLGQVLQYACHCGERNISRLTAIQNDWRW